MKLQEWLRRMFVGTPAVPEPDPVKEQLTKRQEEVADKLAKFSGESRDDVLAEAYRRADRLLTRGRTDGDG